MQTSFEQKLRSAVRAGWWTFLIALAVVLLQWLGTAVFFARKPEWFLRLFGPDMSWARIESMTLQFLMLFRLFVGIFATLLVWASLWSVVLRRREEKRPAQAQIRTPAPAVVVGAPQSTMMPSR